MATILSWKLAGPQAQSGTTPEAFYIDCKTLMDTKLADSAYSWQVASINTATYPYYIVLKRKDGSAGRILMVTYSPAPGAGNVAIFEQIPVVSYTHIAWFPSGNVDTPSNLSAASGTIMGDDTNCTLSAPTQGPGGYTTGFQWGYADTPEALYFWQTNTSGPGYLAAAGKIIIDSADVAYDSVWGGANHSLNTLNSATGILTYTINGVTAGTGGSGQAVRARIGGNHVYMACPWIPSPISWTSQSPGSVYDMLVDSATGKAWFPPIVLMPNIKGAGFKYKLRQVAVGPAVTGGPMPVYNSASLSPAAICIFTGTSAGNNFPWLTNFRV